MTHWHKQFGDDIYFTEKSGTYKVPARHVSSSSCSPGDDYCRTGCPGQIHGNCIFSGDQFSYTPYGIDSYNITQVSDKRLTAKDISELLKPPRSEDMSLEELGLGFSEE